MKKKEKIIKDLVHGYIGIDNDTCLLIDSPSFQRLKHVSQLSATSLYPSAKHDRFEHSLGVMHLALMFFKQIENEIISIIENENSNLHDTILKYNMRNYKLTLKYAALLHDVGHAPLSHIGEAFYDNHEIRDKLKYLYKKNVTEIQ